MSQPRDPYRGQTPYRQQPYGTQPRSAPPRPAVRRIPGLGLVLTLVGLVIQVLSLTVLPWIMVGGNQPFSISMLDIWDQTSRFGTHGFGEWYIVLASYPMAALGIVLALAVVLDSVALKVIWAALALLGLGILVLRYGFGPIAELAVTDKDKLDFTTQEITTAIIALAAVVIVIFTLKTAVSMFRRVAGLILIALAGVHIAAVVDLVKGSGVDNLGIGAYGPAVGYLLIAVAAFTAPRKVPGV